MTNIEAKIINKMKNNYKLLIFILITLLALLARVVFLNYQSGDYKDCLSIWFNYLKLNGGFKALATYVGNYNAPYVTIMALLTYLPIKSLYSIKLVSILFDFFLAGVCGYFVKTLTNKNIYGLVTYSLILFLPQVLTNGAMWGQCDSIYTLFIIISLLLLIKSKYLLSFIFLGIAFAFKLQTVFVLPIYILIYISDNKFSILNFLLIPIVDIVLCLPALIMGMPFSKCFTIYISQVSKHTNSLVYNFPNLYQLINNNFEYFKYFGIITLVVICILITLYVIFKKVKWNSEKIITMTLLFLIIATYTLPGMHERYLYVGEILSIIYYILYRKNLPLVIILNLNAFITYSVYLNGLHTELLPLLSLIYGIIIINFMRYTLEFLANKNDKKQFNRSIKYEER